MLFSDVFPHAKVRVPHFATSEVDKGLLSFLGETPNKRDAEGEWSVFGGPGRVSENDLRKTSKNLEQDLGNSLINI